MTKKKVHNLNANSLELRMKQMVTVTESGMGVCMDCEIHEVPNKRENQKNEDHSTKDTGKV